GCSQPKVRPNISPDQDGTEALLYVRAQRKHRLNASSTVALLSRPQTGQPHFDFKIELL
ncbi:hypothetical protein ACLOJK_023101, partial [Asimina triloba]